MKTSRYDDYTGQACPIEAALELIGGKWKGMILYHLLEGTLRSGELMRALGKVSQRMLTKQLRELESSGLIERTVHAQVPPRVDYSLSATGESLREVLSVLKTWGERYAVPTMTTPMATPHRPVEITPPPSGAQEIAAAPYCEAPLCAE